MNEPAAALGRIPSGLFVLTACRGDSETGMLGSWVQQCSFRPLRVSLAVNPERDFATWLVPSAVFVINILDESQNDMVAHFGRGFKKGEPAFQGLEVQRLADRGVILTSALAYLECQVVSRHPAGDHDLVVAEAIGGKMLSEGRPLVHIRKSATHY